MLLTCVTKYPNGNNNRFRERSVTLSSMDSLKNDIKTRKTSLIRTLYMEKNNPKYCRNTKTISLATQLFKSLNGIPHFQTAPADPTVHLICLHVLPPPPLPIFLFLTRLVFLGHLFLAGAAAELVLHPLPGGLRGT